MKVLYMAFGIDSNKCEWDGVYKKILGQKGVFEGNFEKCDIWLSDDTVICQMDNFKIDRIIDNMEKVILEYDIVYLRMALGESSFHRIIKYLSKTEVKTFVEVPTYNFSQEMMLQVGNMWGKKAYKEAALGIIGVLIHKYIYFPRTLRRVNYLVTISHPEKVPFVKHVNIENGIDVCRIKQKKYCSSGNTFKMIVVANLSIWHGIDRVIRGIKNYIKDTGKEDVELMIVGTGKEEQNLKELVERLELKENVFFVGRKMGQELDECFDVSDVAISTMAFFRTGMMQASTLKSREYCARGIPYVVTEIDWDEAMRNGIYKVPEDESPLEISKIKTWYDEIKDYNRLSDEMRNYAEKQYTWDRQLVPVIEAMKNCTIG